MSNYKEANIDIDQINPDFENPRHPEFENIDQIYEYMFAESKLINLIKDIAKHGISPLERFAVLETNGVYITLEGNRRLTALKALNDPSQVPVKHREDVVKAANGFALPSPIVCVVYTERRDADIWIARKHQGESNGIGPTEWDTEAKSRQKERAGNQRDNNSLAMRFYDYAKKNLGLAERNSITIPMLSRWLGNPIFRDFVGFHSDETASSKEPKRITSKVYFDHVSQLLIDHLDPAPPLQQSVNKAYVIDQMNNWRATSSLPEKRMLEVPLDINEPDPFDPETQPETDTDNSAPQKNTDPDSGRDSTEPHQEVFEGESTEREVFEGEPTDQEDGFSDQSDDGYEKDNDDQDEDADDSNSESGVSVRSRNINETKRVKLISKVDLVLKASKYAVYKSVLRELANLNVRDNPIAVCFLARSVIERVTITYYETVMNKQLPERIFLKDIYTSIAAHLKTLGLERSLKGQSKNLHDLGNARLSNFSSYAANSFVHGVSQPIAHESVNRDFDNISAILEYMVAQINANESSS